jgi:acyl-CoA synthetase (AMP-forming)/AMP-acid ligase II
MLAENAYRLPHETATVCGDRRISFLDHFTHSRRLASALARLGVRRQDRIAILSKNRPEYIDIFGAAQLAGFIATTVNFRLAAPEIEYVLRDSAPAVLFFEEEHSGTLASLRAGLPNIRQFVCLGEAPPWASSYMDFLASGDTAGAPFCSRPDDVMHLIYTSGTTGRPKGVMRTHGAELAYAQLMTTEVGVLRGDVVQIMMPLFHVGARWLQISCHLRGARVVLHSDFGETEIMAAIQQHGVTVTHMAPTIVQRIIEHPRIGAFDLSSLRTIYYSAAPMPVKLLKQGLEKFGPVFIQLYGMTEGAGTTLHKSQHNPDGTQEERARLASVGQCPAGVQIRIADDSGTDLPEGTPGEVMTRTSTHMRGYWNNSIATLDAMQDGWYKTGDIGYLDGEGYLFLVDRKKDMIISGGENIYCREVEEAISSDEAVTEVAVIGIPDPDWGESVKAIVVLKPDCVRTEADIIAHCKSRLASYKKPRYVAFVEALPRLNTGKVDKKLLRATHGA